MIGNGTFLKVRSSGRAGWAAVERENDAQQNDSRFSLSCR